MRYTKKNLPRNFYCTLKKSKRADPCRYEDNVGLGGILKTIIDNHIIVNVFKTQCDDLQFRLDVIIPTYDHCVDRLGSLENDDRRIDNTIRDMKHDHLYYSGNEFNILVDEIGKIFTTQELLDYIKEH